MKSPTTQLRESPLQPPATERIDHDNAPYGEKFGQDWNPLSVPCGWRTIPPRPSIADQPSTARSLAALPTSIICLLVLVVLLQVANIAFTTPLPAAGDGQGYMAWGKALMITGHWDPTPFIIKNQWYADHLTNGHDVIVDKYPIGWSLATLPAMALGHALTRATNFLGLTHYAMDGSSPFLYKAAWIGVYCWVDLGLICAFLAARRMSNSKNAQWSLWLTFLGTSALAYTWRWSFMSHGVSLGILSILTCLALQLREENRPRTAKVLIFGALAGLFFCVRIFNCIYLLPILVLPLLRSEAPSFQRALRIAALAAVAALPFLLLEMYVWKSVYGNWYFNGYARNGEGFAINWLNLDLLLASSEHGLFFMHPLTILCFIGLGAAIVRSSVAGWTRAFAALMMLALLGNIFLYGFWSDWTLGASFGARWAADPFIFWVLGLAFFLTRFRPTFSTLALALLLTFPSTFLVLAQTRYRATLSAPLQIYLPGHGWNRLP